MPVIVEHALARADGTGGGHQIDDAKNNPLNHAWRETTLKARNVLGFKISGVRIYDVCLAVVVTVDVFIMGLEANARAECVMSRKCNELIWAQVLEVLFLMVYIGDIILRLLAKRGSYL